MSLNPGQKLGPYVIEEQAGAGGMGEVYKARDTRLDRTVAIKVLPGATAQHPDVKARFQREAKAISSLNHPNICTLYDIGHEDGVDFLVMEYLEGVSLSEKITAGGMNLNEIYDIAGQIADALDKAHRQGLIHRDLKPGNVMLTSEGAKLLDFGLAKIQGPSGMVDGLSGVTQTTPITGAGAIVGTVQYMAPEQLEGKEADARSDIFSFGALLYEMITGQQPFEGKSQAGVIAAIIEREPIPVSEIKPLVPPGLTRLVRKCLAKDPDDRWQSARDLSDELRWIAHSGSQAGVSAVVTAKRRFKFRLAWVVATVAIIIAVAGNLYWLTRPEEEKLVKRYDVYASDQLLGITWPQVSPNGKYIAYRGFDSTSRGSIWIRPIESLDSYQLPGTENANRPFWSPDGKYLAFMMGDQLKRIPVAGGPAQLLAEFSGGADGTWGSKGIILMDGSATDSIRGVSLDGGDVFAVTTVRRDSGEVYHAWPEFLPDGEHFVYLVSGDSTITGTDTEYRAYIGRVGSDWRKALFPTNSRVVYAEPGYLVYERGGTLLAVRFDASSLELTGESIPLTDKILNRPSGNIGFSLSREGTLVYETQSQGVETEIQVFDRNGKQTEQVGDIGLYSEVSLSPDGTRLLYLAEDGSSEQSDYWVRDLRRGATWRLTFSDLPNYFGFWSDDGEYIYYSEGSFPALRAFKKRADGSESAEELHFPDTLNAFPFDVSKDGSLYSLTVLKGQPSVWVMNVESGDLIKIASSPMQDYGGIFSPNEKYICYISSESGRTEVYVRRSDGTGGKWQISTDGGNFAQWSADGTELFYWESDKDFMVVPVVTEGVFSVGIAEKLFNAPIREFGFGYPRWSSTRDAQRFYAPIVIGDPGEAKFQLVENWALDLENR